MTKSTPHRRIADLAVTAGEADSPLAQLDSLGLIAFELERLTRTMVEAARGDGASWQAIGDALGTSRQAAWERFGR